MARLHNSSTRIFLAKQYDKLRRQAFEMAQGLDLADAERLSIMSIREEWLSEETQYRPIAGYAPLLEFIRNDAACENYKLLLNQEVLKVEWKPGGVKVHTAHQQYHADALITTISLGSHFKNSISFEPAIPNFFKDFSNIGFGQVIKMAFEFDTAFWNEKYPGLGFLFTEGGITFWSQLSQKRPILTGWIGDGYIQKYDTLNDVELEHAALAKLSEVFIETDVAGTLKASAVFRHTKKAVAGGGYSWLTTESKPAIRRINKGIENTLWFAGEALHPGAEVGTVEAALQSGKYVAREVQRSGYKSRG